MTGPSDKPQPGRRRRRRRPTRGPAQQGTSAVPAEPAAPAKPQPTPPAAPKPARAKRAGRDGGSERGLRDLIGAGRSQLGVDGALRGRDVKRPTDQDLANAERDVVIVRRNWKPPTSAD